MEENHFTPPETPTTPTTPTTPVVEGPVPKGSMSTGPEKPVKRKKNWKKIAGIVGLIVLVLGTGAAITWTMMNSNSELGDGAEGVSATTLSGDGTTLTLAEGENLISKPGIYTVTGTISNGYIHVNAGDKDEVKIILKNVSITNPSGPAIYVESNGNTYIELVGENNITATASDTLKGAIHSKADLLIDGDGTLNVKSSIHGIVCKDDLEIDSGTFNIEAGDDGINTNDSAKIDGGTFNITASGDGIHTDGYLEINDGTITVTAREGLEGTYVVINGGTIVISASDDGINAADKSTEYEVKVEINGGDITIKMGQGDTDGIDSNGDLVINGGTLNITCNSPFDYEGTATYNGGTMIINGTQTTTITNQFENEGGGGMPGGQQGGQGGQQPGGQGGGNRMMR